MSAHLPALVLIAVTCIWGSTFVVTKDLLQQAPPLSYVALRFSIAAAGILLIAATQPKRTLAAWRRPHLLADGVLLGLLNAGGMLFQVFGQLYTTPSKSAFITSLNTPLTAVMGFLLHRLVPTRPQRIGVLLATVGLALLTWPGGQGAVNTGDLLTCVCALLYGVYIVESARRAPRQAPLALATVQIGLGALVFSALWAAAQLAIAYLSSVPRLLQLERASFPRTPHALAELAYMAIVCVVVGLLAQTWAFQRLSATTAALIFALEPVVATAFAVAVGGPSELPGPRGMSGAFLVLCAIYVAEARPRRLRRTTAAIASAHSGAGEGRAAQPPETSQPDEDFGPQ